MTFEQLGLDSNILKALNKQGYTNPTPIQQQAIPILLKGKDLLGCAQTGTGKTAAFAIPIIQLIQQDQRHHSNISALIVTPTRELAIQIGESFDRYSEFTGLKSTVIFGGVKQGRQVTALRKNVDILVATPGRLLDLIDQRIIRLDTINYFVLDEADQMLDMGFINDIKKIIQLLPKKRQSLFFSATMPKSIINLSKQILGQYEEVSIAVNKPTADLVSQELYHVAKKDKVSLLIHLLNEENYYTTLVFSRTKHGADKIVGKLKRAKISAEAIHGNKAQNARQRTLKAFKDGKTAVLVATDIAARGIDVSDLSLVVNYDLPNVAETYVHRIGRTGRAKASGVSKSFCDAAEVPDLKAIEKLLGKKIPVVEDHPYEQILTPELIAQSARELKEKQQNKGRRPARNQNRKQRPSRGQRRR